MVSHRIVLINVKNLKLGTIGEDMTKQERWSMENDAQLFRAIYFSIFSVKIPISDISKKNILLQIVTTLAIQRTTVYTRGTIFSNFHKREDKSDCMCTDGLLPWPVVHLVSTPYWRESASLIVWFVVHFWRWRIFLLDFKNRFRDGGVHELYLQEIIQLVTLKTLRKKGANFTVLLFHQKTRCDKHNISSRCSCGDTWPPNSNFSWKRIKTTAS